MINFKKFKAMKKLAFLLSLGLFLTVSCEKREIESPVSDVSFTPCKQNDEGKNELSGRVNVEFTDRGVQITHYNFEVTCDFTTVNVTHTFRNGVLNITQQGSPNQANCICYTDVSYTISGISKNEVNVIFINGVQVYCHNDNKEGYVTFGANYHVINCLSTVTIFLDRENIGTLQRPVNAISECGEAGTLTKKIPIGEHTYRVEIQGNCEKNITGTFVVSENECEKIFIDYFQIFNTNCDKDVIISKTEYDRIPTQRVSIIDMKIVDDCLKIKFSSSGCDGSSWIVELIDSEHIAYSITTIYPPDPPQRTLKLSLENNEDCAVFITKEISFNIKDLQVQNYNRVYLNIWDKTILYEY